jgi:hypothetical protein
VLGGTILGHFSIWSYDCAELINLTSIGRRNRAWLYFNVLRRDARSTIHRLFGWNVLGVIKGLNYSPGRDFELNAEIVWRLRNVAVEKNPA